MKTTACILFAALGLATPAFAADHEVKALNRGPGGAFVFDPPLLRVAPGDRVTFKAVDANHTVGTVRGMIPAGAQPFKSERSKDLTVTFTTPGIYGYECFVHIHSFGMTGMVVVGNDLSNMAAAKSAAAQTPPVERAKLEALLAQAAGG